MRRLPTESFYATELTKIENGVMPPSSRDVEAMIGLCLPALEQTDELRVLVRHARRHAVPGPRARQYLSLERLAVEIRMVYNEIPGLLQTREYAHAALSTSPLVAASAVGPLAAERAERSRTVIRPDGARLWIALGEEVLERASGGPAVLRDQLRYLRKISAMPNVRFRLVPKSAGTVSALSVPFTHLHMADGKSIAFVATTLRGDYVKASELFTAVFQDAWERATPEEDSAAMLDAGIAALSNSEEG
ncbi:DUF5753 domain-containing protein [Saccharothrix obliqua]|uniref:DUF5753 domain-containing protein n=1 Tax=Saccharothrix obliqua TaxID=2861747 RepID=UPI001C5F5AA9|nr:DUF5753 domain-containing protein [Saccharothrix obliqua]MBW4720898.1 DUF5753 domain-containing protein [Saccharothrix obliqua]